MPEAVAFVLLGNQNFLDRMGRSSLDVEEYEERGESYLTLRERPHTNAMQVASSEVRIHQCTIFVKEFSTVFVNIAH